MEGIRGPFCVLQKLQMFGKPQKTADSFIIGVGCGPVAQRCGAKNPESLGV